MVQAESALLRPPKAVVESALNMALEGMDMLPRLQVVDLYTVAPDELEALWCHEIDLWRRRLLLDVSATIAVLRRLVARQRLQGKALRLDGRLVGYTSYIIAGHLAVILGMAVASDVDHASAGAMLLQHAIDEIRGHGVQRIESQLLADHPTKLSAVFRRAGFRTYWHDCLRLDVLQSSPASPALSWAALDLWQPAAVEQSAELLYKAYTGKIEAEIHARYRSLEGCRQVLDAILVQGSCGPLVAEASGIVRHRGQLIGLIVITEGLERQAHLPQVAIDPAYQGRGLGRMLLDHSVSRLSARHFDTLSLIVSYDNAHATKLYYAKGFQAVFSFPIFAREQKWREEASHSATGIDGK
jgi:ribosomal protein S18 acetylase RimI-like enzyme